MKHRTFFALLFVLLLQAPAWACELPADYVPIAERPQQTLLFKVHGCNAPVRYLLGTFHSDAPELNPLLIALTPTLEQTKRLWVEVVSSPELMRQTQQLLLLPENGPDMEDLLGNTLYAQALSRIAPHLQMDGATFRRYRPWAPALLVQYPAPKADGIVFDHKIQILAAKKAIGISGLETLKQQLGIFMTMPETLQKDFVENTLDELDTLDAILSQLEQHFINQDLGAIHALGEDQWARMEKSHPELAAYLRKPLIDDRNERMTQSIVQNRYIPAFIAVGALHLTGKTGLLSQLEQHGLQITPVKLRK